MFYTDYLIHADHSCVHTVLAILNFVVVLPHNLEVLIPRLFCSKGSFILLFVNAVATVLLEKRKLAFRQEIAL